MLKMIRNMFCVPPSCECWALRRTEPPWYNRSILAMHAPAAHL